MALEFPADPAATYLERQYMLGDRLLVAPVMSADGELSYVRTNRIDVPWQAEIAGTDSVVRAEPGTAQVTLSL